MTKKHVSLSCLSLFNISAGICSIASFLFFLFGDSTNACIALVLFGVFLFATCSVLFYGIWKSVLNSSSEESLINFVFLNYEVLDDIHHIHDAYKIVQCKRPFLSSITHRYKWTGKIPPKIASDLQDVGPVIENSGDCYDEVELILKSPLFYNQSTTLHFHAELDDSDGTAQPFLEYRINTPMAMVMFKVVLKNKQEDDKVAAAVVERKKINTELPTRYENVQEVMFDKRTNSYTYPLMEPKAGYYYRLRWGEIH